MGKVIGFKFVYLLTVIILQPKLSFEIQVFSSWV